MIGWLSRTWQQPSAVLLTVQLISVLLFPFMEATSLGRLALSTLALVILFVAVRSWVMIDQVAGLLYVALDISRIVGPTIARQGP